MEYIFWIFTSLDLIGLVGLASFVFVILFIAEFLKRKEIIGGTTTRKIVHLSVGNVVLLFPFIFSSVWIALIGPSLFIIITYFTCPASPIEKLKLKGVANGHTFGTVYYALALTVLVILFFRPDPLDQYNIILMGSFMPLVWGDGFSAVIGSKFGNNGKQYKIFGGTKTLLGSWAAAFATFAAVSASCLIFQQSLAVSIYIGLLTGFITAIIEAITPKGFDNLAVPATNALALFGLFKLFKEDISTINDSLSLISIVTALIIGLVLAVSGIIFHALTWDGAIAGFYFGVIILGLGSWTWGAMYGLFFVLGSLFTFVGKEKKKDLTQEFEKGESARDSIQAMVNSLIPAILALLFVLIKHPILAIMAAGALATSLADTFGTEIGSISKKSTYSALKPWVKKERGSPGAISVLGTLASAVGATLIGIIGFIVAQYDSYAVLPKYLWIIIPTSIIGGFIGSYFDSVFASTIQRLNKCTKCNKITEKNTHCSIPTVYYSGIKWIRNDLINLLAIVIGAMISGAIFLTFMLFLG